MLNYNVVHKQHAVTKLLILLYFLRIIKHYGVRITLLYYCRVRIILNNFLLFDLFGDRGGNGGPGGRPTLLERFFGRELLRRRHDRFLFNAAARQLFHRFRHRLERLFRLHAFGLLFQMRVGRVFGHLQ